MAQPVWVLSVDLQTKTATFQSGMAEAAKSARGAFTEIKSGSAEMGASVGGAAGSARQAVMLLGDEFGVHLPRGLTMFIASLGPVGAAMEAAFPFVAIALGATLLLEHLANLKAAGVKLTEDQVRFGTTAQNVFNSLNEKILQTQIRTDELRNDHLGALQLQLQLIDKQSMAELAQQFGVLGKAADVVFEDLKSHWYSFSSGSAGAKRSLDEFTVQYEALLAKGDKAGASNLLSAKLERETKILALLNQADNAKGKKGTGSDEAWAAELQYREAINGLKRAGVDYDTAGLKSQQAIVKTLQDQARVEALVASQKAGEGTNAKLTTDKAAQSRSSEGAREAAEHTQKMGELTLNMEREQAAASATLKAASIAERLASDIHLADEEAAIQMRGNQQLIAALNRGADDYNNQLKSLQDKAAEISLQHTAAVAGLTAKASEAQYRQDLQDLIASEQGKIEATERGSAQRLAAIDAALKEEASKNLQSTASYRDLLKQKAEVQQQFDEESRKLSADAGKEDAANTQKIGELTLAAERSKQALLDSARRVSATQQLQEDLYFANESYDVKMAAMLREESALDKTSKDYENKLKAIQNKELQMVREHENQLTKIKDNAEIERNRRILSAEEHFNDSIASGLTQVLMGHKSFASMMNSIGNQVVSGMMQNAIKSILTNDMTKESDAAAAARKAYLTGESIPVIGPIMGPVLATAAFAGVMAFQEGTDSVPGIGTRDTVPAMLAPGEGVVPGGVMDGLRNMARSGSMGGGTHNHAHINTTYHVQALDSGGMEAVLDKHAATLAKHVGNEIRKMNR